MAAEILEKGQVEVVLDYLVLCGRFWSMDGEDLARWTAAVEAGESPDFGANLYH